MTYAYHYIKTKTLWNTIKANHAEGVSIHQTLVEAGKLAPGEWNAEIRAKVREDVKERMKG